MMWSTSSALDVIGGTAADFSRRASWSVGRREAVHHRNTRLLWYAESTQLPLAAASSRRRICGFHFDAKPVRKETILLRLLKEVHVVMTLVVARESMPCRLKLYQDKLRVSELYPLASWCGVWRQPTSPLTLASTLIICLPRLCNSTTFHTRRCDQELLLVPSTA